MALAYSLLGLCGLVLVVLLLLLFVPVYATISYDGDWRIRLRVLGIPIELFPCPQAQDKAATKAGQDKPDSKKKPSKWQQIVTELRADGPAATLRYLSRLAALVGTAAGRTLRAVTVDKLHLEWIVATGEPADTAVRYGQVCTALYPPLAAIGRLMRIRRQEIRVEPNFLLQESDMRLDVRLHIAVYRLVAALIALAAGVLFMRETSESATAGNKPKEE